MMVCSVSSSPPGRGEGHHVRGPRASPNTEPTSNGPHSSQYSFGHMEGAISPQKTFVMRYVSGVSGALRLGEAEANAVQCYLLYPQESGEGPDGSGGGTSQSSPGNTHGTT